MRNAPIAITIVALLLVAGQAAPARAQAAWELTPVPAVEIREIPAAPLIDGNLDEVAWRGVPAQSLSGPDSFIPTLNLYIAYHQDVFYVGCEMRQPQDGLEAKGKVRDAEELLADDAVELILDPRLTLRDGHRILVNSRGVIYDALLTHGGTNEATASDLDIEAGATSQGRMWSVELAIPFRELGMGGTSGEALGLNVLLRQAGQVVACMSEGEEECSLAGIAVAGLGFASLDTDQVRLEVYNSTLGEDGLGFEMAVRNRLHQSEQFDLAIQVLSPRHRAVKDTFFIMIDAHETGRFERGPYELGEGEACVVLVEVTKRNRERASRSLGYLVLSGKPAS
ncbi:MAG: hypothetical protein QM328_14695 [Acidobacteriota bacterium]|nr:hypothetical protein [Acidobacteriota bacterium]